MAKQSVFQHNQEQQQKKDWNQIQKPVQRKQNPSFIKSKHKIEDSSFQIKGENSQQMSKNLFKNSLFRNSYKQIKHQPSAPEYDFQGENFDHLEEEQDEHEEFQKKIKKEPASLSLQDEIIEEKFMEEIKDQTIIDKLSHLDIENDSIKLSSDSRLQKNKKNIKYSTSSAAISGNNRSSENQITPSPPTRIICTKHDRPIQYICKTLDCLKELCGHCILQHRFHIESIEQVDAILKNYLMEVPKNPQLIMAEMNRKTHLNLKQLDQCAEKIWEVVNNKIQKLKTQIEGYSSNAQELIEKYETVNQRAKFFNEIRDGIVDEKTLSLVKSCLQCSSGLDRDSGAGAAPPGTFGFLTYPQKSFQLSLQINEELMFKDIETTVDNHISLYDEKDNFQSTEPGQPQILHWFEWGKKRVHIFDILTKKTQSIELDIAFQIPSFSRSILLPNGQIFLMGGEEPEYISRKDVYMYDTCANDNKLHQKASMLHQQFDFSLAHFNNFIFCLCGKDSSSEVTYYCEKYDVEKNIWTQIEPASKQRYAASAVGCSNHKIYLFGGRSDNNSVMVKQIQEYNIQTNKWSILDILINQVYYSPVEVCACLQISHNQILIFGGSDSRIKDSSNVLTFDFEHFSFDQLQDLQRPQVFVTAPFRLGKFVYAIGNQYYMKHRNLHRFSVEKEDWDIIFER